MFNENSGSVDPVLHQAASSTDREGGLCSVRADASSTLAHLDSIVSCYTSSDMREGELVMNNQLIKKQIGGLMSQG